MFIGFDQRVKFYITWLANVTQSVTIIKLRRRKSLLHSQWRYMDLELFAEGFLLRICAILGNNNGRGNIIPPLSLSASLSR